MRRLLVAAMAWISFAAPSRTSAFGTQAAHESLADAAFRRALQAPAVGTYLRHDLGLARGAEERLAVQYGLDASVDDDLVTDASQADAIETRLNRSLSWYDPQESGATFRPFAPDAIRVFFEHGCRAAPDFDSCYAALERAPIGKLIQIGTYAEDNPNPRAQHHFHDPERSHGISGHGLDNSSPLSDSLAGTLALEVATIARGGDWRRAFAAWLTYPGRPQTGGLGNFDLRGRSAIDRALNLPGLAGLASEEYPENRFALPDAERYLYRSLASAAEDDRENYLALHFIALGHVLHLLQDQASSPHTRNDFIRDHILADKLPGENSLETNGDDPDTVDNIIGQIDQGDLLRSLPFSHLASQGLATAFNVSAQAAVDALGADVADFWDRGDFDDPEEDPSVAGLAERVHNGFFSEGTISNSFAENGYALPRVPSCALGDSEGSGATEVRSVSLPERSVETGATIGSVSGRFLSSPLVPHLARCRYHAERESAMGIPSARPWSATVRDSSVQRDYLELLFPLAIDYGAKFLQHYLAPRIEVVPTGPGEFTLRNLTALPFTADADTLEIAYTAVDAGDSEGRRARAPVECDASELVLPPKPSTGPASLGDFTCTLPASLSPAALDALDFWVVVRGQLGERGEVGSASEYDASSGPKDFVVAFDRVQPQLLVHRAAANEAISDPDARYPLDVVAIPLDVGRAIEPGDVPATEKNLTAALRAAIGSAALDLAAPDGEPGGIRIALRSDRDATETHDLWSDVAAPLRAFVFDPTRDPSDPAALIALPTSESFSPSTRAQTAPLWATDGGAVFYYEDASFSEPERPTRDRLVRALLADPPQAKTFRDLVGYASSDPDEAPDELPLGSRRDVCRGLDTAAPASATVVAGGALCIEQQVVLTSGQKRWADTSDFHQEIRIGTVIDSTDEPGKLEVVYTDRIDVGAGSVVACGGSPGTCWQRGSEPAGEDEALSEGVAWSRDGTKLAFLRDPTGPGAPFDQEIWVADLVARTVRRVMTASHGDPDVPEWTPDGKHLVFGMALGEQLEELPSGAMRVSSQAIDVHAIRADGPDSQAPTRLTSGLQPYSIGLYAPLFLPSAP